MDHEQAEFFRVKLLPIVREAAEDDATDPRNERNPLRPMLRMLLGYIEYLDGCIEGLEMSLHDPNAPG